MKVADGFWLSKKGYEVNYASQAYKRIQILSR